MPLSGRAGATTGRRGCRPRDRAPGGQGHAAAAPPSLYPLHLHPRPPATAPPPLCPFHLKTTARPSARPPPPSGRESAARGAAWPRPPRCAKAVGCSRTRKRSPNTSPRSGRCVGVAQRRAAAPRGYGLQHRGQHLSWARRRERCARRVRSVRTPCRRAAASPAPAAPIAPPVPPPATAFSPSRASGAGPGSLAAGARRAAGLRRLGTRSPSGAPYGRRAPLAAVAACPFSDLQRSPATIAAIEEARFRVSSPPTPASHPSPPAPAVGPAAAAAKRYYTPEALRIARAVPSPLREGRPFRGDEM
jgi:hypothetical protein